MRKKIVYLLLITSFIHMNIAAFAQEVKMAPKTKVEPVTETLHGVTITDPYRWLEDQQSPETRAWIDRQNAYTDSVLDQLPQKQRFAQRVEQLLNTDQIGTPVVHGGRYFFTKRAVGQDLFS